MDKIYIYILFFFFIVRVEAIEKIVVFSGGVLGLVEMEADAISSLIENELEATERYSIIETGGAELEFSYKKKDQSTIGQITSNLLRARADTLSPSLGEDLDGSQVVIWHLKRSGRTYDYDFRLYSVQSDKGATITFQGESVNKRYLKGMARTTSRFTGSPENAADAARLMAWQVVGLTPPDDRFDRGLRAGLLGGLKRAYTTFWFAIDSGFESLLILVALLIMGGGLVIVGGDTGEDLGYPPDYPGVP
ncbi:MAG: hypothetical protein CMG75_02365 [Candidatus Marinimicrobia bacterium]|nr:hypothetical protein [Candidatus Neomarinimicrobiota bacterium]|tara:strand:+ start:1713 stop:2459 length:747 start_codon:yes stop_codon:yes gene_type:complete